MAYTTNQAVAALNGYLNISESKKNFIENTKERGFVFELNSGEKIVIFVYPLVHKQDNTKNYFDTRDSGAYERGVAWNYAIHHEMKYFCIGVNDSVDKYMDYAFSLECSEQVVEKISGTENGSRNGPGNQIIIPNDYIPSKPFERITNKLGIYIVAVHRNNLMSYLETYDNRPYMVDTETVDVSLLEHDENSAADESEDDTGVTLSDVLKHNLFGIHIKEQNDALSDTNPHVCIGWSALGDLSAVDGKKKLSEVYDQFFQKNNRGRGQDIGQIWRFLKDVQVGDYIIYADDASFHIGKIDSNYYYDNSNNPAQSSEYTNNRKVIWLKKGLSRSILSSNLNNSLKTAMSIWSLNDYKLAVVDLLNGTYIKDEAVDVEEEFIKLNFKTGISSDYERNRIVFGAPGTGKSFTLNEEAEKLLAAGGYEERVTFHPDYSYANFVGTYKPVMVDGDSESYEQLNKEVISIMTDKTKTAQEKYDLLYDEFKNDGFTRLPILLGLYTDESFKTRKQDGTDTVGDNSVERNHGRALRPYVTLSSDIPRKEEISYEYVPGPFMRVLAKALKNAMELNPQPHLLIIEEINRANVAAVFGDIFQLLDRASNNASEYEIATTNEMRSYLAKELGVSKCEVETIRIPDNMFIWATMNSADQGVFPMDTAFKRRWDFKNIGIDDGEDKIAGLEVKLGKGEFERIVEWNELRKAINDELSSYRLNEDKLLGPFFLSLKVLKTDGDGFINSDKFIEAFKNKIIMYLFEDAAKQKRSSLFMSEGSVDTTKYSSVCKVFDEKGIQVFHPNIYMKLDNITAR